VARELEVRLITLRLFSEETAAMGPLTKLVAGSVSPEKFAGDVFRAIAQHAQYGITTIQDGASRPEMVAGLRAVAAERPLPIDVAAYIVGNQMEDAASLDEIGYSRDYLNGVRVAGVKFILDGSPQGRTAWLTRPYDEGPPGADPDYVAYAIVDPDLYKTQAGRLIRAGIPFLAHANGDAAIDLMIEGVDLAVGEEEIDHRSVAIHAQLAREDQLDEMKRLGIVPSFFAAHPYFWGDWHRKSFGDDRALRISPLRSTIEVIASSTVMPPAAPGFSIEIPNSRSFPPVFAIVNVCVDVSPVNNASVRDVGDTPTTGGSSPSPVSARGSTSHSSPPTLNCSRQTRS
jgi:hypothetical protein